MCLSLPLLSFAIHRQVREKLPHLYVLDRKM